MAVHQPRVQARSMYRCDYCKVWLQDDPITRRTHSQGKKHQENIKLFLLEQQTKRVAAKQEERKRDTLLANLEQKANASISSQSYGGIPPAPSGAVPAFAYEVVQNLKPPTLPVQQDAIRLGSSVYRHCVSMGYVLPIDGWPVLAVSEQPGISSKRPRQPMETTDTVSQRPKRSRWDATPGGSGALQPTPADSASVNVAAIEVRAETSSLETPASAGAFVYQDNFEDVQEEASQADGAMNNDKSTEATLGGNGHPQGASEAESAAPQSSDAAEWAAAEEAGDQLQPDDADTAAALGALRTRVGPEDTAGAGADSDVAAVPHLGGGGWSQPSSTDHPSLTSSASRDTSTDKMNASADTAIVQGVFRSRDARKSKKKRKAPRRPL